MSWRTVVISQRAKLDLRLNYLVIRGEIETKIHISEILILVIENTAVSMTASLLAELIKHKVKVVFCDEKRNPNAELIPYYGSHDSSSKLRNQLKWRVETKEQVWTTIVREKIRKQRDLLSKNNLGGSELLSEYINQIVLNDATNREGHAAKVYFSSLFGKGFTRDGENPINSSLNYGYSILLSIFNREIVAGGYITQLGLSHANMFNPFNFSSDLMEPFRPIIDGLVHHLHPEEFGKSEKVEMLKMLSSEVFMEDKRQVLSNAIKIYCKSIFDSLDCDDPNLIRFYFHEL